MEAAKANLRLVGDTAADTFPWPETGELLSFTDAHSRIEDLKDRVAGMHAEVERLARDKVRLERRIAADEDPTNHAQGAEIVALIERWKQATGHTKSKVSGDRVKAVKARLAEDYTIEQLELALDGIAAFPYVGTGGQRFREGKKAQRHDRIGIALGGGEAVERFAVLGHEARAKGWTPEGWPR